MLTAESTLLEARRQMAVLVAEGSNQRVALLLAAGGGYNPGKGDSDAAVKVSAIPKQDATP
jgi:outer membrane protein TolC